MAFWPAPFYSHCVTELHINSTPERTYYLKFMFPIEGMRRKTFLAGYGSAIISFEWTGYLSFDSEFAPIPPPVATFRGEICPADMEISSGIISPIGSVIVGN